MKYCAPFFLLALLSLSGAARFTEHEKAWNPDAGLVRSFTEGATVSASSNPAEASKITDGNYETAWQSGAPLPDGFVQSKRLNLLLGKNDFMLNGQKADLTNATDGNLNSEVAIENDNGINALKINWLAGELPSHFYLKCQAKMPIEVLAEGQNGVALKVGEYSPDANFQFKKMELPAGKIHSLTLQSKDGFLLFEMAALAGLPIESVTIDFGKIESVGTILTRHWAGEGSAVSTKIYLSENQVDWQFVAELDPLAEHPVLTAVSPEVRARYLKLEHTLPLEDWKKVFVWEVKAYDRFGPYGQRPRAEPSPVSLREMLGVNGYWSWGTDRCSADLPAGEGPKRYAPVASHGRNYHDMTWDLTSPGQAIDFSKMKTEGTPAKNWLDWDREYRAWVDAGLSVQASLQFFRFAPAAWQDPENQAFAYAKSFVSHFGAWGGNGLVCSVEAGNEPWEYPADIYQKILLGMARGAAEADPNMEVFPCALQAADPSAELTSVFKNYIGARVTQQAARLLDGINIHAYSYLSLPNGKRQAVQPEHPHSTFWEILNAVRWRDVNMPGKKIYLSEWGWDSDGAGQDCTHAECVSEKAAACYAVRGALIASRLGIERATWFFYANVNQASSLYARSGLTGSLSTGFEKKQNFRALQSLVENAGESYFYEALREDEQAWIYLLADKSGKPTHYVAWAPVDGDDGREREIFLKTKWKIKRTVVLSGDEKYEAKLPERAPGGYKLSLSAVPVLFEIEN